MPSTTSSVASAPEPLDPADPITALAGRLGHRFAEPALLADAVRHRSWCAEHPGFAPNERLEFLGDAVLGLVVAEYMFSLYPDHDEGWLSRARSALVRSSALARMANELQLGEALLLGKGEDATGGREKASILADALEAVIGAIYLDGGWAPARAFVLGLVRDRLDELTDAPGVPDAKSRLQELASRDLHTPIRYDVDEVGPEHDKTFIATAVVGERLLGRGTGRSKKEAEQLAASEALDALAEEPEGLLAATPRTHAEDTDA
jgi:ribonuclease III